MRTAQDQGPRRTRAALSANGLATCEPTAHGCRDGQGRIARARRLGRAVAQKLEVGDVSVALEAASDRREGRPGAPQRVASQ
eukprot:13043904-Alexandrium_andersonii.AAC.1